MELRDSIFNEVYKLMKKDDRVVMLNADHGAFGLDKIAKDFPDRHFNVGVAEQNMIDVAAGLALDGKKPFVYSIINFTTFRCLEQINVSLSMMNLPVIILGVGAGYCYSTDGPTHHGVQDIGIMNMIPNLEIYNVSDNISAKKSIEMAYLHNGPSYIRFDKGNYDSFDVIKDYEGGRLIHPIDSTSLIISTGSISHDILKYLIYYKKHIGLIDIYQLKPLSEIFMSMDKLHPKNINIEEIVVIEEHFQNGGFGSMILEELYEWDLLNKVRIHKVGIFNEHRFHYSNREEMSVALIEKAFCRINNLQGGY